MRGRVGMLLTAFLAASALSAGEQFLLDTTVNYQPSQESECSPAVAFGASEHLVVWQTARFGEVCAQRVTRGGGVLDLHPIWLGSGYRPVVAFDGVNFLVAWGYMGIRCTRVAPSGAVLDTSPIPVCTLAYAQFTPAVASGDSVSLVVWTDVRDSADTAIYATRVTRSGTVPDPDGILVTGAIGSQDEPAVTSDGNDWLVVWRDDRNDSAGDIFGARVSASGIVLDTAGIPICRAAGIQANPSVSFGDSVFLVTWDDSGTGPSRDIYCTRVTAAGEVLDSVGILVTGATNDQTNPAIAFNGADFQLSWVDNRNGNYSTFMERVLRRRGLCWTRSGVQSTTRYSQDLPTLAHDDTLCLTVWQDSMNGHSFSPDIYAARVNRAGRVADPHGILLSCGRQSSQTAARAALADSGFPGCVGTSQLPARHPLCPARPWRPPAGLGAGLCVRLSQVV